MVKERTMSEYKRFTEKTKYGTVTYDMDCVGEAMKRLAELEDKLENGTLIEIDHSLIGEEIIGIHHYTDGTYQLDLDENIVIGFAIDGVITWNGTHHFNDEFRNGMFFIDNAKGRAEAEARLRELEFKERVDCGNATIIED